MSNNWRLRSASGVKRNPCVIGLSTLSLFRKVSSFALLFYIFVYITIT